jgi:Short C-terminal domain
MTDAPSDQGREPSTKGGHRKTVAVLLVAASVFLFVGIFSVWVNRQALNTENWVNTSSKLLENEQVQEQVATYLVNQLYANVDVEAELKEALPPQAKALAGPAAGGLRQLAQQVAERALTTPQVQAIWADANRAAHEQLLKVINGGGAVVSTEEGEVTLHLGTLVTQIGSQTGLPGTLTEKLPPEAGTLTVLDSQQLSTTQKIAKAIRRLPIVLIALVILLYGGAIYLARGRRREAVRAMGFGFIVTGVLVLLLRNFAGTNVVDSLASTASIKPAAEATWDIATSLLVTVASSAIAFGILAVVGAWLAGGTAPARALRRELAPYAREDRAATYGVAAAIWLALIAWAPIAAFRKPFGVLLFAALFALGAEVLRRQAVREFPHGQPRELGEWWRELRHKRSAGRGPDGTGASDQLDALERLSALRREGALTDEEFEAQKRTMLA